MSLNTDTRAVQDYLKTIYLLGAEGHAVTTTELAERLQVSPASVTAMVKRLAAESLLEHRRYHGVRLTPAGEALALRMVRRHRLVETFLHRVLGVPWDEVHAEAEQLEHAISERLEERIAAALGDPDRDCHGDPIPPKQGRHDEVPDQPLDEVGAGERVRVARVSDRDPAALRYLAELRVVPGTELVVEDRSPFGGPTWVRIGRQRHPLSPQLSEFISVAPVGD